MTWSEYGKWSLSLARDVLAHLQYLLHIIGLGRSGRALEIGSGTGLHSCFVSYFGVEGVAIDASTQLVKVASINARRHKAKNLSFVVADARSLPFRHKAFNVCFSQGLLEHLDNPTIKNVIAEASRVTARIIFSIPATNYPTQDFGNERLLTPSQWRTLLSEFNTRIRYYTLDLQSIKNSLLSRRIPKPWHILIEILQ